LPGFEFVDPPFEDKFEILIGMERKLAGRAIHLSVCCEKEILDALPHDSQVTGSSCVPGDLLQKLYGGRVSLKKDIGQRVKAGCGCKVSADIGSYRRQPCFHNCLFCYANPSSDLSAKLDPAFQT
jgi:hypothetical protein